MSSRPLGRSLDPLPGESLNGFLLRLSCRLRVSPAQLARLGIVTSATRGLSRRLLLDTDSGILAQFARLSVSEAAGLTLVPWADRYPPIARSLLRGTRPRPPADDWLFAPETRHCPRCLAGDGSAVQDEFGGCWRLAWHLPIVFACLGHRLPLQAGCTQDHPAEAHGRTLLIRLPGDSSLHPAQCRQPLPGTGGRGRRRQPCGQRLDQPGPEPARLDPEALAFQGRMLAMLDSGYPAEDAAAYFTDLRVATAMLCVTWPASRDFTRPADQALISQHVSELGAGTLPAIDRPPRNPLAAAALLTAAAAVIDDPGHQGALARTPRSSRAGRPSRTSWAGCDGELYLAAVKAIWRILIPAGEGAVLGFWLARVSCRRRRPWRVRSRGHSARLSGWRSGDLAESAASGSRWCSAAGPMLPGPLGAGRHRSGEERNGAHRK